MPLLGNVSLRANYLAISAGTFIWRVVAVLVLGALLAHWIWVFFAPRSVFVLPAVQPASGLQAEHLFGIAPVSVQPAIMPNVRLIGVFAGTPGFAIIELDGKQQGLATGREIVPGAKLVEVAKDHIVIERNGVSQQIQLEGKDSARAAAVSVQPSLVVPAPAQVSAAVSASSDMTSPK